MDTTPSTTDPDVIYALYKGDYNTQLVRLALRLEMFAPLAAYKA
jgi:hypothetical protein